MALMLQQHLLHWHVLQPRLQQQQPRQLVTVHCTHDMDAVTGGTMSRSTRANGMRERC